MNFKLFFDNLSASNYKMAAQLTNPRDLESLYSPNSEFVIQFVWYFLPQFMFWAQLLQLTMWIDRDWAGFIRLIGLVLTGWHGLRKIGAGIRPRRRDSVAKDLAPDCQARRQGEERHQNGNGVFAGKRGIHKWRHETKRWESINGMKKTWPGGGS